MAKVKRFTVNREKKRSRKRSIISKYFLWFGVFFRTFSAYTSLHGFVYIAEEERNLAEKLFWIFVIINVFVICGFQTTSLIQFWDEGNILVTKESASIKVWDIPFPALTICSENQINTTEMYLTTEKLENRENFTNLQEYVEMLCDPSVDVQSNYSRTRTKVLSENVLRYLVENLVLECEKTILRVFWANEELTSPCEYFQPIIMSTGVCYSLNMISHEDLFNAQYYQMLKNLLDRRRATTFGVKDTKFKFNTPWRVAGDTLYSSITMSINLRHVNFKQYCQITGDGLKMFIHNPFEHPLLSNNIFVTGDNSYLILITPKSVTTSNSLVKWKAAYRGCFYQAEKVLRYFKIYTQSNCELECRINKTIERCGCVPFYLPRFKNTNICGMEKVKCVTDAASTQFSIFTNKHNDIEENNLYLKKCRCLPSCSELTYNTEMSQTATNWTHIHKVNSNISSEYETIVVVTLHFKKKSVDNWVRSPVIRFNELIANIGGIVSLYTGCSIVSLFEIMCFIALKKWAQSTSTSSNLNKCPSSVATITKSNHIQPILE